VSCQGEAREPSRAWQGGWKGCHSPRDARPRPRRARARVRPFAPASHWCRFGRLCQNFRFQLSGFIPHPSPNFLLSQFFLSLSPLVVISVTFHASRFTPHFSLSVFSISAFPQVPHDAHSSSSNFRVDPFFDQAPAVAARRRRPTGARRAFDRVAGFRRTAGVGASWRRIQ
jgi:hypothetical protein